MSYRLHAPDPALSGLVDCYWFVDDEATDAVEQKIIPDGYPEIIFHYGDPYEIRLRSRWERQAQSLMAGQITRYFHLRNTGRSSMVGIKLKPSAPARWFGLRMEGLTDAVIDLQTLLPERLDAPMRELRHAADDEQKLEVLNRSLLTLPEPEPELEPLTLALERIFATQGTASVAELRERAGVGERMLERLFKRYVGLGPKFYSRVVRFSAIFKLAQGRDLRMSALSADSGYYDQPHFSRDFKAFTGEDPSKYGFGQANIANFFLNRP